MIEPDRFRYKVDIDFALQQANLANSNIRVSSEHILRDVSDEAQATAALQSIALELNLIRRLLYVHETRDTRDE